MSKMTDYSVTKLSLSNKQLTELPKDIHLYKNLKILYCDNNQLTTLPENLPVSIVILYCNNNHLTTLPENLPASIQYLYCYNNPFTKEYDFEITTETLPRYYLEKEEREKSRGDGMYNAVFK